MTTRKKTVTALSACLPPEYAIADAESVQALARGEATPTQQKRALEWIINSGAATYDQSYRPGDTHDTSFAEGRRFVGTTLVKLLKLNINSLIQKGIK